MEAWPFWCLAHCEVRALRKVWEMRQKFDTAAIAALRADIHNSSEMLQRRDKKRWTPQDFGASAEEQKQPHPIARKWTVQEFRERVVDQFGVDGKGKKAELKVVQSLKGKGQPLPKRA